jgi:hypothetical protein
MRGIYIVGNDKVAENAIALLNSIRCYDKDVPIYLIPFNENYHTLAATVQAKHDVKLFPDLELVERWTAKIAEIFDRDFLKLPNKMRKIVQWFGPLDEFLYIDTDIIVFEAIANVLDYLQDCEFLCCDYHHSGRGLEDVFSHYVREQGIFSEAELEDVFNSGFWGARKSILSEAKLEQLLRECAQNRQYFDFSRGTTDQPILNYVILKSTTKRVNLVKVSENEPGSWAGSSHFQEKNHILYDGDNRLRYLHWAGSPMRPGGPYRDLWEYYRYLGEDRPPTPPPPQPTLWQTLIAQAKRQLRRSRGG